MVILLCIVVICFTTAAQLLLKKGSGLPRRHVIPNSYILSGYILFGFTVAISYLVMQRIEMKYFAALMSMNYVAVAVASALLLNESMGLRRKLGTLLITVGVALFALG
jgi:drug/metabolite transporter (DMT)-like permease